MKGPQRNRLLLHAATIALVATIGVFATARAMAQSPDAVHVATYLDVRQAASGAGAALALQYVRATRAEAGNVAADVYQEIGRSNHFVLIETWNTRTSFADHEQTAHTLQFRAQLRAIQRSPFDQRVTHGFLIDPMPTVAGPAALYVVTHVDVPGTQREATEGLLRQLSAPTRADPGHVRFDIYQQDEPRANHFTLFAVWNSRPAFDDYGSTAHWLQFREALAPLLGALYDERLYRPVTR